MKEKILLKLEDHSCFLMWALNLKIVKFYNKKLEPYGLKIHQYFVLVYLWEKGDAVSTELQKRLSLASRYLKDQMVSMEEAGLLKLKKKPGRFYPFNVRLTAKGKKLENTLKPVGIEIKDTLNKLLPEMDLRSFEENLDIMEDYLEDFYLD